MRVQRFIDLGLAAVWLTMGLYCKILGQVPRHQDIAADILGAAHAPELTRAIGGGEALLGAWIGTGWRRKWSAGVQIGLVLMMNVLEVTMARDRLLWGGWNGVFALGFCSFVYWNAFIFASRNHA